VISDRLAAGLAFHASTTDGFVRNVAPVRIPRDGEQGFHGIVNTDSRGG
jgi:hypothetical protein